MPDSDITTKEWDIILERIKLMLPTMYGPNAVDWASYTEGSTWSGYATARTVDATDTRQEELLELAKRILGDS